MNGLKLVLCLVAAELCGSVASGAAAQSEPPANEPEIVVEAPRTLPPPSPLPATPLDRSPFTGAPIITTVVRISALYGDLDLKKPESASRLLERIERVARDACATLDRLYPLNPDPDCVGRAVAKAAPAARAVISGAARE